MRVHCVNLYDSKFYTTRILDYDKALVIYLLITFSDFSLNALEPRTKEAMLSIFSRAFLCFSWLIASLGTILLTANCNSEIALELSTGSTSNPLLTHIPSINIPK